jgi:heat-inducible transcriptional repressor
MARDDVGERKRRVLRAVVKEYIRTAEPVASETLVRRFALGVSSATVRNDLADLEELGLLGHPHTSAGRVPTDRGYRYFIESLMGEPELRREEQMMVRHQFHQVHRETEEWLRLAASVLARLSRSASIVTVPHAERSRLKHLEVVPIQDRRALLVVVLDGGIVRQQLLEFPAGVELSDAHDLSARLSDQLAGQGADRLRAGMTAETSAGRLVVEAAARILAEQDVSRARQVYYDGFMNLLRQPEFESSEPLRDVLGLLEDRTRLDRILPASIESGVVHVSIGAENALEPLQQFSVVVGGYGTVHGLAGYMGILGPTRIDYSRCIGAVRYVGTLMSELMRAVDA